MDIVIVGVGQVGETLCEVLTKENHNVVVIDTNQDRLDQISNLYDVLCVQGNGAVFSVQKEANVKKCHLFIAVSPHDEINIIAAMTAKRIGADYCIARVRNPDYMDQMHFMRDELGIDLIINPEMEAAREIFNIIRFPSAQTVDKTAAERIWIISLRVMPGSKIENRRISQIDWNGNFCLVVAIERGEDLFIPNGRTVIHQGDLLFSLGQVDDLTYLSTLAGVYKEDLRSVMIIGAGRVAGYLIPLLLKLSLRIKIIDPNKDALDVINEKHPKVITVVGNGGNQSFLIEERIQDYDAVVTLTNYDEENLIISIFANQTGVRKTITKINRLNLIGLLREMDDQSTITPHEIIAEEIIRSARVLSQHGETEMTGLIRLAHSRIELAEFVIQTGDRIIHKPLKDLKIRENILIALIMRGKEFIIPIGSTEILPGDTAIFVTTDQTIQSVNKILLDD